MVESRAHPQPQRDLNPIILKQEPVISSLEPIPFSFQRVRETDPLLTPHQKLYSLGALELSLSLGGFVDVLRDQVA